MLNVAGETIEQEIALLGFGETGDDNPRPHKLGLNVIIVKHLAIIAEIEEPFLKLPSEYCHLQCNGGNYSARDSPNN